MSAGDQVEDQAGVTVVWRDLWTQTADVVADRAQARWLCELASASLDGDDFAKLVRYRLTD